MRALIVEDEPIFRMDLGLRLRSLGFSTVEETPYAGRSVEIARESSFDLILMDIRLKDELSGVEAAERIAAEQATPIIIMSAYQMDEEALRRQIPSLIRFIAKPITESELRRAVEAGVTR
jgi:CheY-like chemotaxis protein